MAMRICSVKKGSGCSENDYDKYYSEHSEHNEHSKHNEHKEYNGDAGDTGDNEFMVNVKKMLQRKCHRATVVDGAKVCQWVCRIESAVKKMPHRKCCIETEAVHDSPLEKSET